VSSVSVVVRVGRGVVTVVPRRGEFGRASLLCCGLFVAEDPGIIAARRALGDVWTGTASGIAIDVFLAATMTGYNYAASRYVVTVGQALSIDAAIGRLAEMRVAALDADRRRWRRMSKRLLRRLNPFSLIKLLAEGFAQMIEHLRTKARRRALARVAELLGELAAVNLLGVPGAGLESVSRSDRVSSRTSLRHASLFVASWFAGARLLGALLASLYDVPVAGGAVAAMTSVMGRVFDTVTDVRHPIGAVTVAFLAASLIRYCRAVERVAASIR
jgi:hypothetical protein